MELMTKLAIMLTLDEDDNIADVVRELPAYAASTFERTSGTNWYGEIPVSCPVSPRLAEGDLIDDLSLHFPVLLKLKNFHSAEFELHIAIGDPAEDYFDLESYTVALLAALGSSITIANRKWQQRCAEQEEQQVSPYSALPDEPSS